jgi:hypothetical protein
MADALPGILKGLTPHAVWHLAAGLGGYCAVIQLVCCRCEALGSDLDPIVGVSCRCLWKQIRHQRLVRINNENQRKNSSQTTLLSCTRRAVLVAVYEYHNYQYAAPSERFVQKDALHWWITLGWGDNPVTSIGFLKCFSCYW